MNVHVFLTLLFVHFLQYAAIDRAGHCVAIAGKTGLAHYALFSKKWKLFGNETQVSSRNPTKAVEVEVS